MMQNIIFPFKSSTDTRTYNIGYKVPCKSCQCKMLQTYESSSQQFPCIMVHLDPHPHPPFSFSAGLHTVSSLPVAPSQVLITPSPLLWPQPETFIPIQDPGLLFVWVFLKVLAPSPSMPHVFPPPPPSSALYTLGCWHVLCLSSL